MSNNNLFPSDARKEYSWKVLRGRNYLFVSLFLTLELAFLLSGGVLVLLVLRNEIVHVGLSLSKLHLVHT